MKISGFTFVRNAIKYDYPVVESIMSILPLCNEFIVCVGKSEDGTEDLIKNIVSDKIKIVDSVWDDTLREGGQVLAVETNKAFDAVSPDSNWAFYIQADEVVHEQYLPVLRQAMEYYKDATEVDCLVLKYLHFYGNYKYVADARNWYRREVRVIRNDKQIRSYRDAQGFRLAGKKLHGKLIDAYIYHYGWVKNPRKQQAKAQDFNKLWHSDEAVKMMVSPSDLFNYSNISSLALFEGTHPQAMQTRVDKMDWDFEFDINLKRQTLKERILSFIERKTGWRLFEFKNYKFV